MVSTKEEEKEEERRRRIAEEERFQIQGNAAIDPELLWSSRSNLKPEADQEKIRKDFGRLDPDEEKSIQDSRVQNEMRELQIALQERFEEMFRLIEQMNLERVKTRTASQFLNEYNSDEKPELGQLLKLSVEIQSHLSKGLVAIIPELPTTPHHETNIVILPIPRTHVGAEEVGDSNSSFSIEVSSHQSMGAAMQDQAVRNFLGSIADLSTSVGFAIQGLMLADDSDAITMREELIMRQGQLKAVTEKLEEIINDPNEPLLMLFEAMEPAKKDNAA